MVSLGPNLSQKPERIRNQRVAGSTPAGGSKNSLRKAIHAGITFAEKKQEQDSRGIGQSVLGSSCENPFQSRNHTT